MLRALLLVVAHDLLEYRHRDDVTGNLFVCLLVVSFCPPLPTALKFSFRDYVLLSKRWPPSPVK